MSSEASRELAHEMSQPVFTNFDPSRPFVILRKDFDEGTRAMWREWMRFETKEEARQWLRDKRDGEAAYEDRTGYQSSYGYKIWEQDLS